MSRHVTTAGHGTDPPAGPSPHDEEIQAQKPEGREHLRKLLNWEEFDELRDARRSILLDTLYESIIFAVGKGFPWVGVAQVVKFMEELLKETKGCSITEAMTVLASKLRDYQGRFSTKHLRALCDYCHNTFIRHYRLYQYVLGQDQDVHLSVTHLEVCAPPQPLPLAQGVDRATWRREQQVAELGLAEAQRRASVLVLQEALRLEKEQQLHQRFSEAPQGQALRREEVESLVSEAIRVQVECLRALLQHEIQATFDILDLKLQKKTITLGAPTPFPLCITSQPGQDEPLKLSKASRGKKGKARK